MSLWLLWIKRSRQFAAKNDGAWNAAVRIRVTRMDDLVEVEGERAAIERAIALLGLPREGFLTDRLPDFARRFEARTGTRAALSHAALAGAERYDIANG